MHLQIEEGSKNIQKEEEKNAELNGMIENLETKQSGLKDTYDGLQIEYLKEKDEPIRLGKSNENLRIAVEHLRGDLESLNREIENYEKRKEQEELEHQRHLDNYKAQTDETQTKQTQYQKQCKEIAMLDKEFADG